MSFSPTLSPEHQLPIPALPASDACPTRAATPARGRSPMPLWLAPLRGDVADSGTFPATSS